MTGEIVTNDEARLDALKGAHAAEMVARAGAVSVRFEDHLEVIHELISARGEARVMDIAEHLAVTRPTVTKMLQRMAADGWVQYQRYRPVTLTERGRSHAEWMRHRHGVLVNFLTMLGISEKQAHIETEGIEHHLAQETVATIEKIVENGRADSNLLAKLMGDSK